MLCARRGEGGRGNNADAEQVLGVPDAQRQRYRRDKQARAGIPDRDLLEQQDGGREGMADGERAEYSAFGGDGVANGPEQYAESKQQHRHEADHGP